jgi:hypothetical protein
VQQYRNLSGNSGVVAFELKSNALIVQFQNGTCYEYTAHSVGLDKIEAMKRLAIAGAGLTAFISRYAHDAYSRKLH